MADTRKRRGGSLLRTAPTAAHAMIASLGAMSMEMLGKRHGPILRRLAKYGQEGSCAILGGLLTFPENHPGTIRLEALTHMAAASCRGSLSLPAANLRTWLNGSLLDDDVGRAEDPTEDVFVSAIASWAGTTRIFEGIWEANDFYLQCLLSALTRRELRGLLASVYQPVRSMLLISEAVASRSGAERFVRSAGRPRQAIRITEALSREAASRVTFAAADLERLGILPGDLNPFIFLAGMAEPMLSETIGNSALERHPIVRTAQGDLIVALPTAISPSIRRFILEKAAALGLTGEIAWGVGQAQLQRLLDDGASGWEIDFSGGPMFHAASGVHEVVGTWDIGAHVQLLLVHDEPPRVLEDGLMGFQEAPAALDALVASATARTAALDGFRRGLTIVVHGGYGRGFAAAFSKSASGWPLLSIALHDFALLARARGFSARRAWKFLRQVRELEEDGLELFNPNGFANLYACVSAHDFEFAPREAAQGMVMVGTDFVCDLRARLRKSLDAHAAPSWDGDRMFEVERRRPDSFFAEDEDRPIYVCPQEARRRRLLGCVETPRLTMWVVHSDDGLAQPSGDVAFQVWDMTLEWLERSASLIKSEFPELPPTFVLALSFPSPNGWPAHGTPWRGDPRRPEVTHSGLEVRIACPPEYLASFAIAENTGDRWMVEAILLGCFLLSGRTLADGEVEYLGRQVVPDSTSRFFHTVPASTAADAMRAVIRLPSPRLIQEEDLYRSRRRLAAAAGFEGASGALPTTEAGGWLGRAVDAVWKRLHPTLATLDRRGLIEMILSNNEAVEKERRTWALTAGAVLSVHADQEDAVRAAVRRESDRARTGTASRVLAEMALCACPAAGGMLPAAIDFDQAVADVACLIEVANANDALHYGLSSAPVNIWPNMAFDLGSVLSETAADGYLRAVGSQSFQAAAYDYDNHFVGPSPGAPDLPPAFDAACQAEFGATFKQLGELTAMFAGMAMERGTPVFGIPASEAISHAARALGMRPEDAARVLYSFALRPRGRWDEDKPANARQRDWYPWRFGRKLSLIRRPLVALDRGPDSDLLVSVGLLDASLRHLLGTLAGRLPAEMFDSRSMHEWIGSAVDRAGREFETEVRDAFRRLGLRAEAGMSMSSLDAPSTLGDVDVVAWEEGRQIVYIVECKHLSRARTIGEIGERLREFTEMRATGKDRSPIRRHLDRISHLRGRQGGLAILTGLPVPMDLCSWIVTDDLVPMQFSSKVKELVDVVVDLENLRSVLGAHVATPNHAPAGSARVPRAYG